MYCKYNKLVEYYKLRKLTKDEIYYITEIPKNIIGAILNNNGFYYGTQQKSRKLFNKYKGIGLYDFDEGDLEIYLKLRCEFGKTKINEMKKKGKRFKELKNISDAY
ncbi:MAG: hypothetical protein KZY57_10960 [Paeniclostridium sp.]|nr:hypothetical protein [Paeniclostridium sp.]MBW4863332.1 hypothetical protein [Paeniclostridium sp.]